MSDISKYSLATPADLYLAKPEQKEGEEGSGALLWALFTFFKGSLLLNAIPRLFWALFKLSQPTLINRTIRYVSEPVLETDEPRFTGYYLIIAAFSVYVGAAVRLGIKTLQFYFTNLGVGIVLHL